MKNKKKVVVVIGIAAILLVSIIGCLPNLYALADGGSF